MYRQICPKIIPSQFKVAGVYYISFGEHFYIGSSRDIQQRISQHRKKLRANKHQFAFQAYYALFGEKKMYIAVLEICEIAQLKSREKYWIDVLEPDINQDKIHNTGVQKILLNGTGSKKVYQYDMNGSFLAEFPSVREASRYLGVESRSIGLCANPKYTNYKSAHGYRWSYKKSEHLPPYINNSDKAVRKALIVFDILTGEETFFESVASAVRHYNPNTINFDSECATLSHFANKGGCYLCRYLAKHNSEDFYVLTNINTQIYNSINNKFYKNLKEASADMGISVKDIKKACKEEGNKEWLYVNQCARVKLRESGKLFK